MTSPSPIVRFAGAVTWVPGPGSTGITLLGTTREPGSTQAELSLIGAEAVQLPPDLADVTADVAAPAGVLLRSGSSAWRIACRTWQLHRDAGVTFYAAVPARPTPLRRRLAWRVLLGVAATAPGRWLLARRVSKKSIRT